MNMKKNVLLVSTLLGLGAVVAFAAGVPQKFQTDTVQLGITGAPVKSIILNTGDGASNPAIKVDGVTKTFELNKAATLKGNTNTFGDGTTADKSLTFDTGDGGSNKKITLKGVSKDIEMNSNFLKLGDGAASNKVLQFNKGVSSSEIRYNNASSKLEFSHDGITYKPIGSGSGGGGGINLIAENNPGFEDGMGQWTNSGGGATFSTTGTNPGLEILSGVFNSSAASQTLSSTAVSIPSGLQGQPCVGKFWYNTTESTNKYKVQVYDGTNVLSESTLEPTTAWDKNNGYAAFTCPSSGTILLRVISSGDAADLFLDQAVLGEQATVQVGTAAFYAKIKHARTTNCQWTSTFASPGTFPVDSDCPVPTTEGAALAPATKIPGIRLTGLPKGRYRFEVEASLLVTSSNAFCTYQLTDGTNIFGSGAAARDSTSPLSANIVGDVKYTSPQSDITIQPYVTASNGSGICNILNGDPYSVPFSIAVYYYPEGSETGIRADQTGWRVDANIAGGNAVISNSAFTSYTGIEDAGLTLTNNSGSGVVAAQIPCSSTNPPTGTTCAAGSESVGVSFNVPYASDVQACVSFNYAIDGASNSGAPTFQIVETASNSQTIIQEGKSRLQMGRGTSASVQDYLTQRNCGTFSLAQGQRTLRLMFEKPASSGSAAIQMDGDASNGQRDVHWEVTPLNSSANIPVIFKGMVTTNSSSQYRVESVRFGTTNEVTPCSASPCTIFNQSGTWVSSIVRNSTGNYTINFSAGAFSTAPTCAYMIASNSSNLSYRTDTVPTSSSINLLTTNLSGTATDGAGNIICMGTR